MRRISSILTGLLLLIVFPSSYSWNALGHRLVAQIAYNHLTPQARDAYNYYNHALDSRYRPQSLVNAAVWLDSLRYQKDLWLQAKHYIDIPFSWDGTPLIQPDPINAVSAILDAKAILEKNLVDDFNRGFTVRILLHVVGDIHQPLHAANQFTAEHPQGDQGGNLFLLASNPIATNLHAYWDRGGGALLSKDKKVNATLLQKKANHIEKRWPCHLENMNLDPKIWAEESFQLALQHVYQVKKKPTKKYQAMAKALSEQRIALAGCRLAALLNKLA